MQGVLMLFQGRKLGTIIADGETLTITGDKTLQEIVDDNRMKDEEAETFVERLPSVLHGTLSALPFEHGKEPQARTLKGKDLAKKRAFIEVPVLRRPDKATYRAMLRRQHS